MSLETLRPKLTDEFLSTLLEAVRTCDRGPTLIELEDFLDYCFSLAGKQVPPKVKA